MTERDLAAKIVKWLQEQYLDVYQEVAFKDRVADIVAVINRRTWIIETKTSLSLAVMEQAANWRQHANWTSVAIPAMFRETKSRKFARDVLKTYGVGSIVVDSNNVYQKSQPTLSRKTSPELLKILDEHGEHMRGQCPAGTQGGGYWTPFKQTCQDIIRFVNKHPGCPLKTAIESVKHHYSSTQVAKACLVGYIRSGIVKGIRIEIVNKKALVFPD